MSETIVFYVRFHLLKNSNTVQKKWSFHQSWLWTWNFRTFVRSCNWKFCELQFGNLQLIPPIGLSIHNIFSVEMSMRMSKRTNFSCKWTNCADSLVAYVHEHVHVCAVAIHLNFIPCSFHSKWSHPKGLVRCK